MWHEVRCDLCGADDYEVVATRGRFRTPLRAVVCRRCGLVYLNPRPSAEDYARFYATEYWKLFKNRDVPDERFFRKQVRRARQFAEELERLVGPGARVLDVGCGVGGLLYRLAQRGLRCAGIEAHPEHARVARERTGAEIYTGMFEEVAPRLQPEQFHAVVFRHVLEHMASPTQALEQARRLLREGGLVVVECPNVMHPDLSFSRYFNIGHPYNFSPKTMELLLRKCAFAPVEVREVDDWVPRDRVRAVARRANPGAAVDFKREGQDWREVIHRLRRHRWLYPLTLGSLRKKLRNLDRLLGWG